MNSLSNSTQHIGHNVYAAYEIAIVQDGQDPRYVPVTYERWAELSHVDYIDVDHNGDVADYFRDAYPVDVINAMDSLVAMEMGVR